MCARAARRLLAIAGRLLQKCQEKVKEKAERAEREEWLRKNEAELRRQATLVALAEDKERRREAAERAREERAAAAAAAEAARAAASAAAAAEAEASAELLRKARQPR